VHARMTLCVWYSYSYRVSLFNRIIVLRGVMQMMQCYRLVGKGESSASVGTAGD